MSRNVSRAMTASAMALAFTTFIGSTSYAGGPGGPGEQFALQFNDTDQNAQSGATAVQVLPSNVGLNVGILSTSDQVNDQENKNEAGSAAINHNDTSQSSHQYWGARGCNGDSGGGDQTAIQVNDTDQNAQASALALQVLPLNLGLNLAVLSTGDQRNEQENGNEAWALALNDNGTSQRIGQWSSSGCRENGENGYRPNGSSNGWSGNEGGCQDHSGSHGGDQTAVQVNDTDQNAQSGATAVQIAPANIGANIAVLSTGDQRNEQSNKNEAQSAAINSNATRQSVHQGGSGDGDQTAVQVNDTDQNAQSEATAVQVAPLNVATNVSVASSGDQTNEQANENEASSVAVNENDTAQRVTQQ